MSYANNTVATVLMGQFNALTLLI